MMGRFHRHPDGAAHGHEDPRPDVGDHTGYESAAARVAVLETILSENDRLADANRRDFAKAGVRTVNLMSSPGAGKTALLRQTLAVLGEEIRVGILEGDIETGLDAERLEGFGAAVSLVNTSAGFGGECHLDATMVRSGLGRLPLAELDLLVVENVGNLVCPAEFDVGEHAKAMVYAVTEGEEKPLKYPVMFRAAEVVVVNKIDLLPHLDFDLDLFLTNLRDVNPGAVVIQVSARTGEGIDAWCRWLGTVLERNEPMSDAPDTHGEPHSHDHEHGGEVHRHSHLEHDHDHDVHDHDHEHGGESHAHEHAHERGTHSDHDHNP